ncbi:transposable element Tcb1 transposase [Trichonephila clavipes]|uniref:Transposable element Tcb1 transposase n=1 Tax=Trichonephila clavipes TaxID=2585209 RepID=A0A8X6SK40_TRICX|nr:transposable element Tcb1 transposase [Trichonephila clavipes]
MIVQIYQKFIQEQHVCLFQGSMILEFVFMDDSTRPHSANIVNECLQSEDTIRMDWSAFSPDFNPVEHVWDLLDQRVVACQPLSTYLPEPGLRRTLLDEWCNIPQNQIDN